MYGDQMTEPIDQRQRILDSAVGILATKGQSGLTVRAVATAAGCSTTGIYTWFGGKDALLETIYVDGFERFRSFVARADQGTATTPDGVRSRLLDSADRYWKWALENRTHYLLMFAGETGHFSPSPEARAVATAGFDDLAARIAPVLGSAAKPESVADAAHYFWAMLHGHVMLHISGPSADADAAASRYSTAVRMLVDALR